MAKRSAPVHGILFSRFGPKSARTHSTFWPPNPLSPLLFVVCVHTPPFNNRIQPFCLRLNSCFGSSVPCSLHYSPFSWPHKLPLSFLSISLCPCLLFPGALRLFGFCFVFSKNSGVRCAVFMWLIVDVKW